MHKLLAKNRLFSGLRCFFAGRQKITPQDIEKAQKLWADGIIAIGQAYRQRADYRQKAAEHIRTLYAYEQGGVLFKPTLAAAKPFRKTFAEALSYFVGGDIGEDKGFALRTWEKIRFADTQVLIRNDTALAMGHYYFTPFGESEEIKVEYTFGYIKDKQGNLRICLHHSSLPYQP